MAISEWVSKLSVLVPLATGLLLWRRSGYAARWLTRFLCVAAALEVLLEVCWYFVHNLVPIIHAWTWLEFGAIALIYAYLLRSKLYVPLLALAFYVTAIILAVTVEGWLTYPQLLINVENAAVIILAGAWFVYSLLAEPRPNIHLSFGFWFAASHLVYFAGSFTMFTMVRYLLANPKDLMPQAWVFHAWLLVAMYMGYAVALWVEGTGGDRHTLQAPPHRPAVTSRKSSL